MLLEFSLGKLACEVDQWNRRPPSWGRGISLMSRKLIIDYMAYIGLFAYIAVFGREVVAPNWGG